MQTKVTIYGGTNLSGELVHFVAGITKALLKYPEITIISGGFDHYIKHPERKSVDRIVADTVKTEIAPESLHKRFETWVPKENDRTKVVRFREGKIVEIGGSTQARRFNLVKNIDALITIKGEEHTRGVIELALAIDKPVLPIAFTGGESKKMWELYEDDIIKSTNLPAQLSQQLLNTPEPGAMIELSENIAAFVKQMGEKKCLVLMPFEKLSDNFYDNYLLKAIKESGFTEHRIDRNDAAGNIPELFKQNLERARAVIVDITNYKPNVMYELGYVHSKNIKPLIIRRKTNEQEFDNNDLPFYLKQEMVIEETNDERGYLFIKNAVEKFLASRLST